ncbi:1,4-dihydroxy-6-naphthoate synthase [uncultured Desulfovibrio sp.]|uniref:1,4-dihydroxy-6-naphthoate synthase n=1 Tax=uncultured Desulfovibrio sp. TaxID=167968 RepID=UPI00260BF8DC|nr:1,4-dihydroxy-6-naphthoate synthase [uncultured Desulfovibrio sp.]
MNAPRTAMPLGLSPCPNDTFIFHALLHDLVPAPCRFVPHMADVEELNALALRGELPVTKVSAGVLPHIMENYRILSSGGALGWGCGPLVVAREALSPDQCRTARVAIPGRMTTAARLLDLTGRFSGPREDMIFSGIMDAVAQGRVDAGVIIHEGRFTYAAHGLVKLLDLGQWWEETFHAPLPLGVIVARRDLPLPLVRATQAAIAASLDHAHARPQDSADYLRAHAQELSDEVTQAHIRTFVTDFSRDLGDAGRAAVQRLVESAAAETGRPLPPDGLFVPAP